MEFYFALIPNFDKRVTLTDRATVYNFIDHGVDALNRSTFINLLQLRHFLKISRDLINFCHVQPNHFLRRMNRIDQCKKRYAFIFKETMQLLIAHALLHLKKI